MWSCCATCSCVALCWQRTNGRCAVVGSHPHQSPCEHVCCCVPEGELLGASNASRGNHPESPSPVHHVPSFSYPLSSCSIVSSGSCCVACHRIARGRWTPCSFVLVPCDIGLVHVSFYIYMCAGPAISLHDMLWPVRRAVVEPLRRLVVPLPASYVCRSACC